MTQPTRLELKQRQLDGHSASKGTALALAAALCGAVISVTVATAKPYLPFSDLLFYRFLLTAIFLAIFLRDSLLQLFNKKLLLVWLLGLSGAMSASSYYWTLQNMSVGTAMLLSNTSLLFIVILSWLLLKEPLSIKSLVGILIMFLAICLVKLDDVNAPTVEQLSIGLLGAMALAVSSICMRVTAKSVSPALLIFVFCVFTTIVAPTLPGFSWKIPNSGFAWFYISVTIVAGFGANFLYTLAMKHLHAGVAGALTKTAMVWALLFVFFQSGKIPTMLELSAYSLTMIAVVLLQSLKIPRKHFCYSHEVDLDWESEGFVDHVQAELPKLVQQFEVVTSCELAFHFDNTFRNDERLEAKAIFYKLNLAETDLRNGILIAFFKKSSNAVIYFDSGISTQVSRKRLRKWSRELLKVDRTKNFSVDLEPKVNQFANRLSKDFPIAVDDINELSDEVSIIWE